MAWLLKPSISGSIKSRIIMSGCSLNSLDCLTTIEGCNDFITSLAILNLIISEIASSSTLNIFFHFITFSIYYNKNAKKAQMAPVGLYLQKLFYVLPNFCWGFASGYQKTPEEIPANFSVGELFWPVTWPDRIWICHSGMTKYMLTWSNTCWDQFNHNPAQSFLEDLSKCSAFLFDLRKEIYLIVITLRNHQLQSMENAKNWLVVSRFHFSQVDIDHGHCGTTKASR